MDLMRHDVGSALFCDASCDGRPRDVRRCQVVRVLSGHNLWRFASSGFNWVLEIGMMAHHKM